MVGAPTDLLNSYRQNSINSNNKDITLAFVG